MKVHALKPVLPLLLLPFMALGAQAQDTTGVSHPEQLSDPIQTDHYVKPSHATAAAPAAAVPAYQDSFPATAATPEPKLITRDPAAPSAEIVQPRAPYAPVASPAAPVQTAAIASVGGSDTADGEIVTDVPAGPHELTRGTLLHAQLREPLNTATTTEGTTFTAELLADVSRRGEVMLPAGSLIRGHVTSVHGGKRITGGAAMHLRPETISLPDGTLYRVDAHITDLDSTEDLRVNDEGTIVLRTHPKEAAAVVGGVTATAAITGAMVGGGIGAAVGAVAGAGVATAIWLKGDVQENLPRGTNVIFALEQPLTTTPR